MTETVNTGTWYHVCVTRDSGDRIRVFLNGVLDGTAVVSGSLDTAASVIGATQTANYWQGYISNVRAVSGQIPTAYQTASTTVGATIFTPSTSQLTAVSGTSLLTCQSSTFIDNSGLGRTITTAGDVITQQFSPFTLDVTDDHSGQGNHWQPNNLDLRTTGAGADILVDTPTSYGTDTGAGGEVRGNYCTLNPLQSNGTLANGNLDYTTSVAGTQQVRGTFGMSSGKWYWEFRVNTGAACDAIGIISINNFTLSDSPGLYSDGYAYTASGLKGNNGNYVSYGASYTTGDIIGVALDMDVGTLVYYKNGVSQGTAYSSISGTFVVCNGDSSGGSGSNMSANFGQRPFAYTAPSGFKALCTQNLPTPTIGATSTTQAGKYFNPVIWTGNGSQVDVGFSPDLLWYKARNTTGFGGVVDVLRGNTKYLQTWLTDAEGTAAGLLTTNSTGFVPGSAFSTNNYVAWSWKANGAGVTNTAGSITSTVSASTTSGFSIVTYTGTGANATVGHGLGVVPDMMIVKCRSQGTGYNWAVYHKNIGATKVLLLNSTSAEVTASTVWNNTAPTTTVFSIGTDAALNGSTQTYVAYCFDTVPGYSDFGSYVGNGSDDGPFIYTGFRPRFIMTKAATVAGEWEIYDTARGTYNSVSMTLEAQASSAELNYYTIDILSNGFKQRRYYNTQNQSGQTFIYAAFAESPFKYSLAR